MVSNLFRSVVGNVTDGNSESACSCKVDVIVADANPHDRLGRRHPLKQLPVGFQRVPHYNDIGLRYVLVCDDINLAAAVKPPEIELRGVDSRSCEALGAALTLERDVCSVQDDDERHLDRSLPS